GVGGRQLERPGAVTVRPPATLFPLAPEIEVVTESGQVGGRRLIVLGHQLVHEAVCLGGLPLLDQPPAQEVGEGDIVLDPVGVLAATPAPARAWPRRARSWLSSGWNSR